MHNLKKCVHIDIDGTIVHHYGHLDDIWNEPSQILKGVQKKFKEWNEKGYYIIVESARPNTPEWIKKTQEQLNNFGLIYDRLLLGLPNYPRVLINDHKPYLVQPGNQDVNTAEGIMVRRNKGLEEVYI